MKFTNAKVDGNVELDVELVLDGDITPSTLSVGGNIAMGGGGESYSGDYTVTPSREEQVLATKNKYMKDDVTVEEIPYAETSNPYGTTISIAS